VKRPRTAAVSAAALAAAVLAGCGATSATSGSSSTSGSTTAATSTATATAGASVTSVLADNQESHATAADLVYEEADVVEVTLSGTTATASGEGVRVDGATVTITAPGTYRLSGTLAGQVVVDSSGTGDVRLVLDDATITSSTTSAVAVMAADEAVVILADGTTNSLTDGSSYGDGAGEANAALYSAADLTVAGDGALTVTGNADDGIGAQDGLVISSGSVTVTAVDDAIRGKDYVRIEGGTVNATGTAGDALKSDNAEEADRGYVAVLGGTVTARAGDDGIAAATDAVVGGGTLTISAQGDGIHGDVSATVGGGTTTVRESGEGLEAKVITIAGGTLDITSSDDGINGSDGSGGGGAGGPGGGPGGSSALEGVSVTISGGTTTVDSGGDGLDSNGDAAVTGGTLVVSGPTDNGNGALDVNGTFVVSGGTLTAAGSSGMAEAPDTDSEQGWLAATFDSPYAAGTVVQIASGSTVIASWTADKDFASLVFSSEKITSGETYTVLVDGTAGGTAVGGLSLGGSTTGASELGTVTAGVAPAGGGH
jgi:Carbohydrate-binding domain-containing protein Cthe_2159